MSTTTFSPSPNMAPAISTTTISKLKKAITIGASIAATAVLIRTFASAREFQLQPTLSSLLSKISPGPPTSHLTLVIEPSHDGRNANEIYAASEAYLGTIAPSSTHRLRVKKHESDQSIHITVDSREPVVDSFQGVEFTWLVTSRSSWSTSHEGPESRVIELSFPKKDKDMAIGEYLPHVMSAWWTMKERERPLKLHMLRFETWYSVDLEHPSTFDTLAMEPELKRGVLDDLERFVETREYYQRVGRPWRRGYLLHGPSGTGKSSLVAAMANYLKFDVYDLDLAEVPNASVLRTVLAATSTRSILVIEDATDEHEPLAKHGDGQSDDDEGVTLSGVMSSIEGLWSGCGDERIVVFTTDQRERIDPALLRPGRLDVEVQMSYCTPGAFRTLALNYLGIEEHPTFAQVEELLDEVEATTAEVAGELMRGGDADVGVVLGQLAKFLQQKKGDPLLLVL